MVQSVEQYTDIYMNIVSKAATAKTITIKMKMKRKKNPNATLLSRSLTVW